MGAAAAIRALAVAAPIAAALLTACVPREIRQARRLEGRYQIPAPAAPGWVPVDPGGADYAWWSEALSASIYSDSNCGPRLSDESLERLSQHLAAGLDNLVTLEQQGLELNGRSALRTVREGQLDGVTVRLGSLVLKKDSCTYDLVYLAPPADFPSGWPVFLEQASSFRTPEQQP